MSPTKSKAPKSAKASKAPVKGAPKADKAVTSKKSEKIEEKTLEAGAPGSDEDEDDDMGPSGSSEMDFGAAMGEMAAVASKGGEIASSSLKNFRHHPDVENFYRFIFEADLRYEALGLIDYVLTEKRLRKKAKLTKANLH